jgi:hypothetical protein
MRPLNWIQWLTVMMVVALAIVVPINFVQLGHNLRNEGVLAKKAALAAKQATQALCLEKKNYLDQYHSTQKYLSQHPNGVPALGLSAAYLRQAAHKELAAAKALNNVNCP